MKKMNMYEAPKAIVIELQAQASILNASSGMGYQPSGMEED